LAQILPTGLTTSLLLIDFENAKNAPFEFLGPSLDDPIFSILSEIFHDHDHGIRAGDRL
jgi:hypothetical protein